MGTLPEGFTHVPDFLTEEEHASLVDRLRTLDYEHAAYGPKKRDSGEELKRGYVQFGWEYHRSGEPRAEPKPLPDFLQAIVARGLQYCPPGTEFNQAVAMHYPDGVGIGWHTDGKRFGPCVMAVSLATAAAMQFRRNGTEDASSEVVLSPRSFYLLSGPSRWDYEHQVPTVNGERFSLTFRYITADGPAA